MSSSQSYFQYDSGRAMIHWYQAHKFCVCHFRPSVVLDRYCNGYNLLGIWSIFEWPSLTADFRFCLQEEAPS